jgi:two-component system cell cycle sensor histidine kinase PleC
MARTWSVPQRGSIAALGGLGSQQYGSAFELAAGRGSLLALAAILTAAGAVIPHLDAELLSTILFVAGAGLAALVVVLPWQAVSRDAVSASRQRLPDVRSAFGADIGRQLRFPELFGAAAQPSLDRATWAKLTAHMSHELRTPLNAVLGFSEMMTTETLGPLGPGYSAYARDIHASGRALLKITDDALAITALLTAPERKRARETCHLNSVVNEACAFLAPDLSARSIAVAIDGGANVEVVGDHQALRQMLINLIGEASRGAESAGVLRIEAKGISDAVRLSVTLLTDSGKTASEEGFGMILARTLCELSGAELTSHATGNGEWTWRVRLLRAAQADLFAAA